MAAWVGRESEAEVNARNERLRQAMAGTLPEQQRSQPAPRPLAAPAAPSQPTYQSAVAPQMAAPPSPPAPPPSFSTALAGLQDSTKPETQPAAAPLMDMTIPPPEAGRFIPGMPGQMRQGLGQRTPPSYAAALQGLNKAY